MIAFDRPAADKPAERNVLGGPLASCSREPLTGFFRDGCCRTGPDDLGMHTVCAVMTEAFLCLHREGRPLSSAGSIPCWGGGPSYSFSRVGKMSQLFFLS